MQSKLLQTWIDELKVERKGYYQSKLAVYKTLRELQYKVYDDTAAIIKRISNEQRAIHGWDYDIEVIYTKAVDELIAAGINYDREHFIRTHNNGTHYHVLFQGEVLYSNYEFERRDFSYNIVNYYFRLHETKGLYEKLNAGKNLDELAEKEIESYVKSLLSRVEKKYGKVVTVKDKFYGVLGHVVFKCENGSCYLERILAGGYNIQVLHNRILIKEVK